MEKETFLSNLYDYLEKNNYCIIKEKTRYSDCIKAVPLSDSKYFNEKGKTTKYEYSKFYSKAECLKSLKDNKNRIDYLPDDYILVDFYIENFKNAPKDDKVWLLKNIDNHTQSLWLKQFNKVFSAISENKKQLVDYLHMVPISVLEANTIKLSTIDSLLISEGLDDTENFNFYLKFFKARKHQIKDAKVGPFVRDFLLDKYGRNEEKLTPYFDFFLYVKELFQEVELDFVEPNPKYTITSRINCRKAAKLLCIDNFDEDKIKNVISQFVYSMKDYKKISQVYVEDMDKSKGIIEIRCYTDTQFTQEELISNIKQYLLFKKNNLQVPTTKENVATWFMAMELNAQLSSEDKPAPLKRMKI